VFVLFIALTAGLFSLLGGLLVVSLIGLGSAVVCVKYPVARDYAGVIVAHIGSNNNYRLAIMATLTLMCFFVAIKTGPGKPVLITAYHDLVKEASQYTDNQQIESANKKVYQFFWGEKKAEKKFKATQKEKAQYRYGGGGWFWWKLSFMYLFFTLFYIIPAFSDEILDFINDIIIRVKNMKDEIKAKVPSEPATPEATVAGTVKTTPFFGSKIGWFGRLYGSDLASEFTIRLLQGFAKLFSKV